MRVADAGHDRRLGIERVHRQVALDAREAQEPDSETMTDAPEYPT